MCPSIGGHTCPRIEDREGTRVPVLKIGRAHVSLYRRSGGHTCPHIKDREGPDLQFGSGGGGGSCVPVY